MLPINVSHPTYTTTLPALKKTIKYRPFLEKERKILLMALEGNDPADMMNAIIQIISNCCVTKNFDPETLTAIDAEWFFLHLRGKSIGENVTLNFRCDHVANNEIKPCGTILQAAVDITSVEVDGLKKDLLIRFTPTMAVQMKYPSFRLIEQYATSSKDRQFLYQLIAASIDYIATDNTNYYTKDYSEDDLLEFILSLTTDQVDKLEEFVNELPILKKTLYLKCKKCGYDHEIILQGYQSFFV